MTLKSCKITSSTAFRRALSNLWLGFKMRDIFTFVRRSGLLSVTQSKVTHTHIYTYIFIVKGKARAETWPYRVECRANCFFFKVHFQNTIFQNNLFCFRVTTVNGWRRRTEYSTMSKHYKTTFRPPHSFSFLKKTAANTLKSILSQYIHVHHMYFGRVMSCYLSTLQRLWSYYFKIKQTKSKVLLVFAKFIQKFNWN